ncbi:2,3-bisphosphoglycerate-independent phosphoglycerate mutase [Kutzneria sp. NPDC051319]|uniref:2,3-bisphosphoglycerate-independent phosphoglycerate mutase n=1 Tax=Kutzneria sp. NPDC051319 TaxID=3155047 RepID=UPI0034361475
MSTVSPGILLVLDGWGEGPADEGNAIAAAKTPFLDRLRSNCPTTLVGASGQDVGLLPGTVGNSEIGHMVIGAGRPVPYDSVLVQEQIDSGGLRTHPLLADVCVRLAEQNKALHLIGLCSDGMIHANVEHLRELLFAVAGHGVREVWLHAITDGRDVADGTAGAFLHRVEEYAAEAGVGRLASVVGRGYALDKAGNLALTKEAGLLVADGVGRPVRHAQDAVDQDDKGDEWVAPSAVVGDDGQPVGLIGPGDAVLFTNFRSDRIQQLADFLVEHVADRDVATISLAQYDTRAAIEPLVGRAPTGGGLAEELERHGLRSVRVAETEKFEHVTYYINGRDSTVRAAEEHVRITGEGPVDYRQRPSMNLGLVVRAVVENCQREDVDLVVANLANIDVVGHTGDFKATVSATAHTDRAVEQICAAAADSGRWVLLVGDHGNAERMLIGDGDARRPYGGHTTNPVPAVLVPAKEQAVVLADRTGGTLADIAPTVLTLLGCAPGADMSGQALWRSTGHPDAAQIVHCGSTGIGLVGAAFSVGSTATPIRLAHRLDALLRVSEDGASEVLCVHNGGDEPAAFVPARHLPDRPGTRLVFVHGETTTRARDEEIECVVAPHGHVWLGRVGNASGGGQI